MAVDQLRETLKLKRDGKIKKWWLLITIIVAFFVVVMIFGGTIWAYEMKYRDKFFPGSRIGDVSLAGLNANEAVNLLDQITGQLEKQEIKLAYKNNGDVQLKITSAINAISDPDLSRDILIFNNRQTVAGALAYGRNKNWLNNLIDQFLLLRGQQQFAAKFNLEESQLQKIIEHELVGIETITENAKPKIIWDGDRYFVEITPEKEGVSINYQDAIDKIKNNFARLKNDPIELIKNANQPLIKSTDVGDFIGLIDEILATSTPRLTFGDKSWTIKKLDLSQMLAFVKQDGRISVGLDLENFSAWIKTNIAPQIEVEPTDATIEMVDGKVAKFNAHRDGLMIDIQKTFDKLNDRLPITNPVEIAVNITKPKIVTAEVNNMGIKEIIGTGHSNFAGSPANRRHNIRTGASKLHGILIKPGEEFSLIQALGEIDGANGYKQELVIKGNKTTPEYGGGLCQIGTTMFRATLNSGLPITARRNHSYNVTYYLENGLPGTDATIYNPQPDFKFINDTGNYILIQSRIESNDLYFDFWGTQDGRIASRTTPKTWGWTSPPATKYVETLDLPVGAKKCTEISHKGVSASFEYTVTSADGKINKQIFNSTYKPWQAVCLIGVEKLSEPTETTEETASSTPLTL